MGRLNIHSLGKRRSFVLLLFCGTEAVSYTHLQQLEQWNLLPQAETFATRGIQLAGDDLLANPDDNAGALAYARLLARERKAPEALVLLTRILQASSCLLYTSPLTSNGTVPRFR